MANPSAQLRSELLGAGLTERQIRAILTQVGQEIGLTSVFMKGSNPVFHIILKGPDMNEPKIDQSDRSVKNVSGNNVIQTGDHNAGRVDQRSISYPPPESIDMAAELAAIRALLSNLETPDAGKINNALADLEDEVSRETPDKDEVGGALQRALKYAKHASNFTERFDELRTRIVNVAGWLGEKWHVLVEVFT